MTDLSGHYLGRYHLLERLGEGGMAVVYKAYDTNLEREVAIKIIRQGAFPPEALEEVLKRFEREAKALARLSHPNIVKVYDFGEHEGSPYLVMEYLSGGTLKHKLGTPIPWQDVIHLILPIARGVAYAHQHGILHRDIKPANILITENNEPMLTDFGIAKIFEGERLPALTASGMFMGTPEYMAPEQWMGNTSPQSDLYSLGIVIYEMITGRKPYIADTPAAILLKQTSEPLPRPGKFVSGLPDTVERILIKALARAPEDRYEDMNAMVRALEDLFPPLPMKPVMPKSESRDAATKKETKASHRYWLIAGAVILGMVGTILALRNSSPIPSLAQVQATSTKVLISTSSPGPLLASPNSAEEIVPASTTPDPCDGATEPGAREKFTFEQITPCLDTVSKVSVFMHNNLERDDHINDDACGNPCYSPAGLVYENGIDDLHGLVTLECFFLEKNGWDAYHIGFSIENPIGSNFCGVNIDEGVLLLDANAETIGTFHSLAEAARYCIGQGWMVNGGLVRSIRASQITQVTSMKTSPNLMELPWVFHPY